MKHSSTAQTMRHLRVEVMELCEGAGLYQIDLLNGSKVRVSEREYWMKRRGRCCFDYANTKFVLIALCYGYSSCKIKSDHVILGIRTLPLRR